jgi:AcrR family transcriptional regulator
LIGQEQHAHIAGSAFWHERDAGLRDVQMGDERNPALSASALRLRIRTANLLMLNRQREIGFNGFSFREIATDVGVKSSSVYYHFQTMDLAAAVIQRYPLESRGHFAMRGVRSANAFRGHRATWEARARPRRMPGDRSGRS